MNKNSVIQQANQGADVNLALEQDEYLDADLTHIRQCADLVQEEQGDTQGYLLPDDLE